MARRTWGQWASIFAMLAVLVLVAGLLWPDDDGSAGQPPDTTEEPSTTTTPPSTKEDKAACPNSWMLIPADHGDSHRWFANGLQEIRDADTPEEARAAAQAWLSQVKRDPELLAGAARYLLDREVDPATLAEGMCASTQAVALVAELELALADADVTPSEAPENGFNSGTGDGGVVVGAAQSGISGDRVAILIELPNGTKIWIMARCGNPVVAKPPTVPLGPTDENPPPPPSTTTTTTRPSTTTTTLPPGCPGCTSTTLAPKNPAQDPLVNPSVPPAVKGPGSTPPNGNPGPATPPVDSPTGCNGPCSTTTVHVGSGTSGDGSTLPPGGDDGVSDPEPAVPTTAPLPPATGDPGGF